MWGKLLYSWNIRICGQQLSWNQFRIGIREFAPCGGSRHRSRQGGTVPSSRLRRRSQTNAIHDSNPRGGTLQEVSEILPGVQIVSGVGRLEAAGEARG